MTWASHVTAAFLSLGLAASAAAEGASDRLIVAGERVGAVRPTSTAAQLRTVYGNANVRAGQFQTGEGTFDGIVLFPGTAQAIRLYYSEDKKRIDTVEIGAQKGPWRTGEGIRIGSTLAQLEALNGGPVTLLRHEGEGGGWMVDREQPGLKLPRLGLQLLGEGSLTAAETRTLGARLKVRSDDPLIRKAKPVVYKIFVRFGPMAKPQK
jgi:hypothetical protein